MSESVVMGVQCEQEGTDLPVSICSVLYLSPQDDILNRLPQFFSAVGVEVHLQSLTSPICLLVLVMEK